MQPSAWLSVFASSSLRDCARLGALADVLEESSGAIPRLNARSGAPAFPDLADVLRFVPLHSRGRRRGRAIRAARPLLHQAHALRTFGVEPGALLHERVHLVDADVDQLEAAPGRELLHLRVAVERGP